MDDKLLANLAKLRELTTNITYVDLNKLLGDRREAQKLITKMINDEIDRRKEDTIG